MKLSTFETLTYKELQSMDVDTLRKLASEQGKKLNKRVSNIMYNKDTSKIAVNDVMSSGGKFGVRKIPKGADNEKSALISEIKREQKFQKSKSGTVKGAKAQKESIQKATGKTAREYGKEKAKQYKAEEEKKAKSKSKTGKLTKAQKKSIAKKAKAVEAYEKRQYDKAVGEGWEVFHKWREEHPNLSYAKESVKASVDEYVIEKTENQKELGWSDDDVRKALKGSFDYAVVSTEAPPSAFTVLPDSVQLPFI